MLFTITAQKELLSQKYNEKNGFNSTQITRGNPML